MCGGAFTDIVIADVEQGAPKDTIVIILTAVDNHARADGCHLVESSVVLVGHLNLDVAQTIAKHGCGSRRAIADSNRFVVYLSAKGEQSQLVHVKHQSSRHDMRGALCLLVKLHHDDFFVIITL